MKHSTLKKIIISLLSVCLIAGTVPSGVFAAEADVGAADAVRTVVGERVDVSRPERGESVQPAESAEAKAEAYAPDEAVTVIVMLEAPAAADFYNQAMPISEFAEGSDSLTPGKKLAAFLASDDAVRVSEQNKAQQLDILSRISALDSNDGIATVAALPGDVKLVAQYTGVINAMSVRMPYGLLEEVRKLDGVKNAYVEKTYSLPDDEELEPLVGGIERYGYAQAGVREAWSAGYTGKGMLVAVIDTSLDITYGSWWDNSQNANVTGVRGSHEAFRDDSFMSDNPYEFVAYTKNSIAKTVTALGDLLASETLAPNAGGSWYKTLKVPYAADYSHMADDYRIDNNVNSTETHGTHVSGTVLGYVESEDGEVKFSGVAPDAQLMFLKVFDDSGSVTSTTPLLAALNDAAYLGADVVNLSLGSDNGFAYDDSAEAVFFEMLEEFGVVASVSAGNSGNSQQLNPATDGLTFVENPDVTMTGTPAIYDNALAVASVNTEAYGATFLIWNDGTTDHKVRYMDTGTYTAGYGDSYLFGEVNPGEMSSDNAVYDCGYGKPEDYAEYDWVREDHLPPSYAPEVNGSDSGFALVKRGELAFSDMVLNAMNCNNGNNQIAPYDYTTYTRFPTQGLRGVIVYNNEPGYISMDLSGLGYRPNTNYPAISIGQADGEEMAAAIAAGKPVTIRFVNTEEEAAEWPVTPEDADQPGQMSSFSSWGGGPGLELKPDIAAPGGMVYSAVPDSTYVTSGRPGAYDDYNGTYDYMSGTSMAAPHIAGISALVSQYVKQSNEPFFANMSAVQRADAVEHLIVSTANPLTDPVTGGYVSPRRQGAGLVNAGAAIKTPVFVEVDGENVGKLELLDDAGWTGSFDFTVGLRNTTATEHRYSAELVVMTPDITTTSNGNAAYSEHDRVLSRQDLGTVAAAPFELTDLTGKITYNATEIKAASPNGTYIEGYIILTPVGEDIPALSVPFMGFAGDWTAAPILDILDWYNVTDEEGNIDTDRTNASAFFDGIYYNMAASVAFDPIYGSMTTPQIIGANPFVEQYSNPDSQFANFGPYHQGNFTISPNGDSNFDSINYLELYQLRDARVMMFEVADKKTGELYYREYLYDVPRTPFAYDSNSGEYFPYPISLQFTMMGFDYAGEKVVDYDTGEIESLPSGTELEFRIGLFGEGDYSYYVDEDSGIDIVDASEIYVGDPSTWPTFNGHAMDMTDDIFSFDLLIDTDAPVLVNNTATITKQDDGTYLFECEFDDGVGSIASVEVDPYMTYTISDEWRDWAASMGLPETQSSIGTPISEDIIYDEDVHTYKYRCVLPDPASYTQDGPYGGRYVGSWEDGTIYVFCGDYGANDSAYVFQINDKYSAEGELVALWEYGDLYVGDSAPLTVIDNTGAEGSISYTSSDESVATVDESGVITAVGEGTAVITVEKAGKKATVVITVRALASEITDFRFSLENYATLRPDEYIDIRIEDIVPVEFNGTDALVIEECEWDIYDPAWDELGYYDQGVSPFSLIVNDIPGREYYQKEARIELSSDALIGYPAGTKGTAVLTVTLNGCTKSTNISYEIPSAEDYLVDSNIMTPNGMTQYITLGDSVTVGARFYNVSLHPLPQEPATQVNIRVCTAVGYEWNETTWEGHCPLDPAVGLHIVPSKGDAGSEYEGYIVAEPGYDLPTDIYVGVYDVEDQRYTPRLNSPYYATWTYDNETGRFTINYLPYYESSELIISADGVYNPDSEGTTPPPGFVDPSEGEGSDPEPVESLYGPFTWSVADANGNPLENYGELVMNEDDRNTVTFTPNASGTYRLTASNSDGSMSVTWTVIVSDPATSGSVTLVPDTTGCVPIEGINYSLTVEEGSAPMQLVLRAYDAEGNEIPLPGDLVWTTSDGSVVTVDQNGVITAVGVGIATVNVKSASNQRVDAHFVILVTAKAPEPDVPVPVPPVQHQHRFVLQCNEFMHWFICYDCGAVLQYEYHNLTSGVCPVCGYIDRNAEVEPGEETVVDVPTEGPVTEEDPEEITEPETESPEEPAEAPSEPNPVTGAFAAIIPTVLAAAAAILAKRR